MSARRPAVKTRRRASAAKPAGATVGVRLGARKYDVLIGPQLLARAPALIEQRLGKPACAIVTDTNVAVRHLDTIEEGLKARGLHIGTQILLPGEQTKSFSTLALLCKRLLEMGLERGGVVIALGGGVMGDLAGFAASVVRRGVRCVQVPTTLLAQVDSAVGGKTGINTPQGKNLVGTFHQPSLVIADTDLLATLPKREFRAGYAEVAKYGLLGDAAFFGWLERNWPAVFALDPAALTRAVSVCVKGKATIVARDETESGDRMLLNLGHTFGHALEAWCGYSERLLHGEAVSIGICLAFRFSAELDLVGEDVADRVAAHLQAVGLPTRISDIPGEAPDVPSLMQIMRQDKKTRGGQLTFILARAIGEAFVSRDIGAAKVQAFLARQAKGKRR